MKFDKLIALLWIISIQMVAYGQNTPQIIPQKQRAVSQKVSIANPTAYTSDFEQLFTETQRRQLDSLILDFEHRTTNQIAIVTLNKSQCGKEKFDDCTLTLANTWKIGQKDKDNGILIAISQQLGQMRIQNGKGIELVLSNVDTKNIIDKYFISNFIKGNYFEGAKSGLIALMRTLEEKQHEAKAAQQFTEKLIKLIEEKNIKELSALTSPKIYCYLCFKKMPKNKPLVDRRTFYGQHFQDIFTGELIKRLQRNESFAYHSTQKNDYGDWSVLYTIYRNNEFEDGNEGAQFIFWLKDEGGKFKLNGIEAVP